jgi:NarL family two-component system response regulator YdfI
MVVEDSEAFLLRLRFALNASPSIQVVGFAESADSAIRLLEQNQPDLVLLDLYLKQGSGVDVLRHIHDSGTKVRTLVMTSEQSGDLQSVCLSLGAYRFLDKAELLNVLPEETEVLARELAL